MGASSNLPSEAHHYIPKFYLKGFADEQKQLWVYEKGKPPRESKPKYEAQRDNYYTVHDAIGQAPNAIEQMLGKIESIVAPTIRRLANPLFQMNDREKGDLFSFVALTFVRVPAYREFIDRQLSKWIKARMQQKASDQGEFVADCKRMEAETGKDLGDYEKLRLAILRGDYELTQKSAGFNLSEVFQSGLGISNILLNEFNYDVWYAPNRSFFITCDNPVVTIRPDSDGRAYVGIGFGWRNVEVIFPLNKRACLRLCRSGRGQKTEISERSVEQTNTLMMHAADQYLYGPQGYRRISRLFDERGSKQKYGENAFVPLPHIKQAI